MFRTTNQYRNMEDVLEGKITNTTNHLKYKIMYLQCISSKYGNSLLYQTW